MRPTGTSRVVLGPMISARRSVTAYTIVRLRWTFTKKRPNTRCKPTIEKTIGMIAPTPREPLRTMSTIENATKLVHSSENGTRKASRPEKSFAGSLVPAQYRCSSGRRCSRAVC
ncbi:hypothetical protein [Curtobacterium sp. AB7]|uniref:hypothetical protein n=1 Tax=Curtobacterium sp. AB7 TaxID=3349327 RepID=UPI00384BD8E5